MRIRLAFMGFMIFRENMNIQEILFPFLLSFRGYFIIILQEHTVNFYKTAVIIEQNVTGDKIDMIANQIM